MCGRFRIQDQPSDDKLAELFQQAIEISLKLGAKMDTSGDVRPTDIAPVLAPSARNRALGAFPMQWGFTHPKRGMLVFNTRMETAQEREMFAGSVNDRRCLIPAAAYYEWKKIDPKRKERYALRRRTGRPCSWRGCTSALRTSISSPASPC